MNLILALLVLACFSSPARAEDRPTGVSSAARTADIPLRAPAGWKIEEQQSTTILTPGDVAAGRFYAVMVTMTQGKAGDLDELLEDGRKMVAEIGTFNAAMEPRQSRSDGGWDYKFVLGTLETPDRSVMAQVMAIRKGDNGGVVVVLSESVETMGLYADAFAAMVREMGGAQPAQTPSSPGAVDLVYTVPPGWVEQKVNGYPLLVKERNEEWVKFRMSLLIFPTEALSGDVRDQFMGYWRSFVTPNYTTSIAPIPMMARMKSGHACAFDADSQARDKMGREVTVAIYMIAHGGRVVPVMGIYSGTDWLFDKTAEAEIAQFFETARIHGASSDRVPLFSAAELAGEWSESGTEHANYVTRDGAYAGSATISTAAYFTLSADGSYSRTLMAVGAAGNIREKDAGTWSVDDDELVLSKGGRYILLGCGADPKVGRFLVMGNYSNTRSRLKFTNPRGILQALWLKAK